MGTIHAAASTPDFWHIASAHWNWVWIIVILSILNPDKK